jgi:hypothetical protein
LPAPARRQGTRDSGATIRSIDQIAWDVDYDVKHGRGILSVDPHQIGIPEDTAEIQAFAGRGSAPAAGQGRSFHAKGPAVIARHQAGYHIEHLSEGVGVSWTDLISGEGR